MAKDINLNNLLDVIKSDGVEFHRNRDSKIEDYNKEGYAYLAVHSTENGKNYIIYNAKNIPEVLRKKLSLSEKNKNNRWQITEAKYQYLMALEQIQKGALEMLKIKQ